ncbi:MAG: alpha/beta hydrolase [Oscillospiraceae bacterium]|nr:alpha/beta hydrolase [Oscillospiraceae bacterium]
MVVLIVIGVLLAALFAFGFVMVGKIIKRSSQPPFTEGNMLSPLLEPTAAELFAYNATKVKKFNALPTEDVFITTEDGLRLAGKLHRGEKNVTVICCHGYNSLPILDFCAVHEMYAEQGYSILFPHMRAHGDSEGRYVGFGVLDAHDIRGWVRRVQDMLPGDDIFLHGMSMGATAALNSADLFQNGEVSGVIADCGFSTPHEVFCHLIGTVYHLPRFPFVGTFELCNMIAARYDFHTYDVRDAIENSPVPCIYICGDEDRFIPADMALSIAERCEDSLIVSGAGHAASYMLETEKYRSLVLGFIKKYAR